MACKGGLAGASIRQSHGDAALFCPLSPPGCREIGNRFLPVWPGYQDIIVGVGATREQIMSWDKRPLMCWGKRPRPRLALTPAAPYICDERPAHRRREVSMALQINDTAPDFEAETTEGKIRFHDWIGNNWVVLFSHPKDFTPVCTTELGTMARLKPEFDKRGVKIIGLSVDPVDNHKKWSGDIKDVVGFAPNYPMIGDTDLKVSKLYGMLPASTSGTSEGRTPADNQTVRNVFVIGPDKKIKLVLVYPMTTGRNFDEVLRVIDSLQLTAKHRVATPANWKQGEEVILTGAVTDEEAKKLYPNGWKTPKPYMRVVPQPH